LLVYEVSVKLAQDGVVGSLKVVLVDLSVNILKAALDILNLGVHYVVAKVEQLLEHMNELVVFILKQVLYVV
jgi:hypothetical protein